MIAQKLIAHPIRLAHLPGEPKPERRHEEADFRRDVQLRLTAYGWRWTYIPDSRWMQGDPGVPDLLAVRGNRVLFIELKTIEGRLSAGQWDWLAALWASGRVECYVFRPTQWDEIERALR